MDILSHDFMLAIAQLQTDVERSRPIVIAKKEYLNYWDTIKYKFNILYPFKVDESNGNV